MHGVTRELGRTHAWLRFRLSLTIELELRDRVEAVVYANEYRLAEPNAAGGGHSPRPTEG